jgi:hypothetical protein
MRDMGFEYDPSTAGSSVRFDPPDKGDRVRFNVLGTQGPYTELPTQSITFHKRMYNLASLTPLLIFFSAAHPDPTLYPHKIREYGKKLKDAYGWGEEDFLKRAAAES